MKDRKVRLLHVTTVPMSLMFLKGQLNFYMENGFEVHVISSPGEFLDEFCNEEGVVKHEIKMERDISIINDIKSLLKMIKVIKRNNFDIVHTHTPKASLLGVLSAFICGVKVRIYHMHGLVYITKKGLKRKLLYLMEKITTFFATTIYAVSPSLKELVVKEKLTYKGKIHTINKGSINGIDCINHFNPALYNLKQYKEELSLTDDDFIIGFVGRVVKEKGFLELYYAWRKLFNKNINIKLLIVGDLEGASELPKEVLSDIESNSNIEYVGFQKNPAPFYKLMNILVFPTYREGFGLVAIESLAMETPVIASNVVGCVDTIENGVTGFLIPPHSIKDIVQKVEFYYNNRSVLKNHGQMGRKKVMNDYPRKEIWESMLQEYNEKLKG